MMAVGHPRRRGHLAGIEQRRTRRLLVLVGARKALAIAVKRRQPRRWSLLRTSPANVTQFQPLGDY